MDITNGHTSTSTFFRQRAGPCLDEAGGRPCVLRRIYNNIDTRYIQTVFALEPRDITALTLIILGKFTLLGKKKAIHIYYTYIYIMARFFTGSSPKDKTNKKRVENWSVLYILHYHNTVVHNTVVLIVLYCCCTIILVLY